MKLRVAYGLVALSVLPLIGGVARLAGMADGQGAGTQALFLLPPWLLSGEAVKGMRRDALMTAALADNPLIAGSVPQSGAHRAA